MKNILQVLLFFISIQISAQDKKSHFQQYQAIDYMLLFNANSDKESYYDAKPPIINFEGSSICPVFAS